LSETIVLSYILCIQSSYKICNT